MKKSFNLKISILVTIILLTSCQKKVNFNKKIYNKILVPDIIKWDTLKDGFGENMDLLHQSFDLVYIDNKYIYKITTENEIDEDSILLVTESSDLLRFKIISSSDNFVTYSKGNKIDTLFINLKENKIVMNRDVFKTYDKLSIESYKRLKEIITKVAKKSN